MSTDELLARYAVPTADGKYEVYDNRGNKVGRPLTRAAAIALARSFYSEV